MPAEKVGILVGSCHTITSKVQRCIT